MYSERKIEDNFLLNSNVPILGTENFVKPCRNAKQGRIFLICSFPIPFFLFNVTNIRLKLWEAKLLYERKNFNGKMQMFLFGQTVREDTRPKKIYATVMLYEIHCSSIWTGSARLVTCSLDWIFLTNAGLTRSSNSSAGVYRFRILMIYTHTTHGQGCERSGECSQIKMSNLTSIWVIKAYNLYFYA